MKLISTLKNRCCKTLSFAAFKFNSFVFPVIIVFISKPGLYSNTLTSLLNISLLSLIFNSFPSTQM